MQIYNPRTNSWSLGKSLPEGRGGTGKAVILGKKVRGVWAGCSAVCVQLWFPLCRLLLARCHAEGASWR